MSNTGTDITRIERIKIKGRCEKHLPFAVYMNFVKKGVEMMWDWSFFTIFEPNMSAVRIRCWI